MKIDLHTHTKQCKTGDPPTRKISATEFCDTVLSTRVGVIAVTNHNHFDLEQYQEIQSLAKNNLQVWPGVELDVVDDGDRGHLLVIVSPDVALEFSNSVRRILGTNTPDDFTTSIEEVLTHFDTLSPCYVAHYRQKKPDLSDDAISKLEVGTGGPDRVIREVANSISAGIYISHGNPSIYGSDVQNWGDYESIAEGLPELRLPVESFEQFCLLLEKDPNTINTALESKTSETLDLEPFVGDPSLAITVYDDLNVVFGAKGTGKSCILKAIADHYTSQGLDASVFQSSDVQFDSVFDTRGATISIDLNDYDINYCTTQIESLRKAQERSPTPLSAYVGHFSAEHTNRNAKRILLKDLDPQEEGGEKRPFKEAIESKDQVQFFLEFIEDRESVAKELTEEENSELNRILNKLLLGLEGQSWNHFAGWRSITMMNSAIKVFREEIERKTGSPKKPLTTGFKDYAVNRVNVESNSRTVIRSVESPLPTRVLRLGELGSGKGALTRRTRFRFQDGSVTDSSYLSLSSAKKSTQKAFIKTIRDIADNAYSETLFEHVSYLGELEDSDQIPTVLELLMFRRFYQLGGKDYSPSSGEASMILLQRELGMNKDIYILDEPERSLGNEYISDVIVPLVKERARAGKRIFISTHDANIAVRTLPYTSVFRAHDSNGYTTYVGNPFTNNLVNLNDSTKTLSWKEISMTTLEGGSRAFGERGRIYGQD